MIGIRSGYEECRRYALSLQDRPCDLAEVAIGVVEGEENSSVGKCLATASCLEQLVQIYRFVVARDVSNLAGETCRRGADQPRVEKRPSSGFVDAMIGEDTKHGGNRSEIPTLYAASRAGKRQLACKWKNGGGERLRDRCDNASAVEIAILHPYDPAASYASGIRTAISGFIKAAPPEWSIRVVGCTADPIERPVGHPVEVRMGTRTIAFLPILAAHPSRRRRIPLSLLFTWRLLRWRRRLDLEHAFLIFHRLEPPWPLLGLPNPKLLILHYAVPEHVLRPDGPTIWHRFPRLYLALERRILSRVDQIRCPTTAGVSWMSERYPDLADRIRFLPSYADPDHFRLLPKSSRLALRKGLAAELEIDPAAPIGLYVGRFDQQKDPLLLLRSWQALEYSGPPPSLVLVGEGNLEAELRAFVASEGLGGRVRFAGALAPPDVGRWMNAADVLVMSSRLEAMSMAMLEALSCGLPVVAPELGEASRLICRPEAGALVGERSVQSLARAIGDVLRRPADRERCQSCAAPYSPERVLGPIFSLIRRSAQGASA